MSSIPTMGVDNINNSFQLSDGSIVNCHIYDTAGQERYRALNFQYYNKADAVLLVYDISRKSSFENVKNYYISQIKEKCKEDIVILLLGNKADKENQREVSIEEGINLASQENYEFKETSCLQNKNVAGAFEYLVEKWNFLNQRKQKKSLQRTSSSVFNQKQTYLASKGDLKQKTFNRSNSFRKIQEEQKDSNNIVLSAGNKNPPPKSGRFC